jgi:hypothetical protein
MLSPTLPVVLLSMFVIPPAATVNAVKAAPAALDEPALAVASWYSSCLTRVSVALAKKKTLILPVVVVYVTYPASASSGSGMMKLAIWPAAATAPDVALMLTVAPVPVRITTAAPGAGRVVLAG